jgi:hypothetical protein
MMVRESDACQFTSLQSHQTKKNYIEHGKRNSSGSVLRSFPYIIRNIKEANIEILISIFIGMKKLLFLIILIIILSACNKPVCPAYSDSANNVKTSVIQSGAYRANGINKFYRDSYRKK